MPYTQGTSGSSELLKNIFRKHPVAGKNRESDWCVQKNAVERCNTTCWFTLKPRYGKTGGFKSPIAGSISVARWVPPTQDGSEGGRLVPGGNGLGKEQKKQKGGLVSDKVRRCPDK